MIEYIIVIFYVIMILMNLCEKWWFLNFMGCLNIVSVIFFFDSL